MLIKYACNSVHTLCLWEFLLCDVVGDALLKPILQFGGKDLSHWFNAKTRDVSICCQQIGNVKRHN